MNPKYDNYFDALFLFKFCWNCNSNAELKNTSNAKSESQCDDCEFVTRSLFQFVVSNNVVITTFFFISIDSSFQQVVIAWKIILLQPTLMLFFSFQPLIYQITRWKNFSWINRRDSMNEMETLSYFNKIYRVWNFKLKVNYFSKTFHN